MRSDMVQFDEFKRIADIMDYSPIKEEESFNSYCKRIIGTTQRSRTTMQTVDKALKAYPGDLNSAHKEYLRLSRERTRANKEAKKRKNKKTEQTEIDFGRDPQRPMVKDLDDQENVMENEQKLIMKALKEASPEIAKQEENMKYDVLFKFFEGKCIELSTKDFEHYVTISFNDLFDLIKQLKGR